MTGLVLVLCSVLAQGTPSWAGTSAFLESVGQPDLALEAMLLDAGEPAERSSRAASTALVHHLIDVLDSGTADVELIQRATLELRQRRDALPEALRREVDVALFVRSLHEARLAAPAHRNARLAGVARRGEALQQTLAAALRESTSHVQRRRLGELLRRTALVRGVACVSLGRVDATTMEALAVAALGMPDASLGDMEYMPDGLLQQADTAWAVETMIRAQLAVGDLDAALAWSHRLVEADAPVLAAVSPNVLVDVLAATGPKQQSLLLEAWLEQVDETVVLAMLSSTTAFDGPLLARPLDTAALADALARADRPLPDAALPGVALAAAMRAGAGQLPWSQAARLLEAVLAELPSDELRLALGQAALHGGDHDTAVRALLMVRDPSLKPHADLLALTAATRRSIAPLPRRLLERMIARGPGAAGYAAASVRHAASSDVPLNEARRLLRHVGTHEAARVLEQRTWAAWEAGEANASLVVQALMGVLPDPGAARRLLTLLPEAGLSQVQRDVLRSRALAALEGELGPGVRVALEATSLASEQRPQAAAALILAAWRDGETQDQLVAVAESLLQGTSPLGELATPLVEGVLGFAPMSARAQEATARQAALLRQWGRHIMHAADLSPAMLRVIAERDVADAHTAWRLAEQASAVGEWVVAVTALRRGAALGGDERAAFQVAQARAMRHVDPDAAFALAGQAAVVHAGTPEGDAAAALVRQWSEPVP